MREQALQAAVRHLCGLVAEPHSDEATDADLLHRFIERRDEAAFTVLVRRHGPMVRDVCRRLLGQESDVDDAFQAVFLILACKAASVRKRLSLASFLYGIAYRTALRVRRDAARRKSREQRAAAREPSDPAWEAAHREVCAALDEELRCLPERQRAALVLCYLEGFTREEAARQLGQSMRTLDRQLHNGRERLRRSLTRRGISLSAAFLALGLTRSGATAAVPMSLSARMARIAVEVLTGRHAAPPEVSAEVLALMKGVLRNMLRTRIQIVAASLLVLTLLGTATGLVAFRATAQDSPVASSPAGKVRPDKPVADPDVYALLTIEDAPPRLLPDQGHPAVMAGGDPAVYRRMQVILLKSHWVLQATLRKDEVKRLAIVKEKAAPQRWLSRIIETAFLDNTGVLRVSVREGSPEERAVLINALVASYMDEIVYDEQREKTERLNVLQKTLDGRQERLRKLWDKSTDLRKRLDNASASLQQQYDREDLALLRKEFHRVRLEKVGARARLQHRKNGPGGGQDAATTKLIEEIAVFTEQEKMLEENITSLKQKESRSALDEADRNQPLRRLGDAIAVEERFIKDLASQVRILEVETEARPRIHLLQKAEAPRKRE